MPRWIAFLVLSLALIPLSQAGNPLIMGSLLTEAREAQRLVSAFDQKLEKITDEKSLDRLQASGLYCKIQNARSLSEGREDKLIAELKNAFRQREENSFFAELFGFAQADTAAAAAAGHILRELAAKELEICGAQGCVTSLVGDELPFSPLDDSDFASFLEKNRPQIALPSNPADDQPGDCFAGTAGSNYDWNKRSWISSNLNNGEFVVTYDDGPHAENTQKIQAAWSASKYPKPAFFWLSENAVKYRALVQSTHSQGFPVACHSERHADLGNLAKAAAAGNLSKVNRETFGQELKHISAAEFPAWKSATLDREISGAAHTIEGIVREVDPAYRVKHFRLPFGSGLKNDLIGDRFAALDVDHFFWRVDSLDWQDKNSASVLKRVLSQMKSGKKGIILFHDIQAPTVNTTKLLLETFEKSAEFKPVSIRQMVP
jgi:peptidoglycan/xylan/chitin deacetylase (PgdA/CDA1 family)